MSDYDFKFHHLRTLHHSDRYSTVRLTVCLAWLALLSCADSHCHFFEAQQLAQNLLLLAKNTKQDTSISSNTSHFKPSLVQAHSQPMGALASGAEASDMKLFRSGCVPACGSVVLFMCWHGGKFLCFPPASMLLYLFI